MKIPNVYDYINHSGRAISDGYKPCYLTRVSAVVCNVTGNGWGRLGSSLSMGLDQSIIDNLVGLMNLSIAILALITLPVSCWFLAFLLPKGEKDEP